MVVEKTFEYQNVFVTTTIKAAPKSLIEIIMKLNYDIKFNVEELLYRYGQCDP